MIDTHTHLYDQAFCADGESPSDAVRRALEAGVEKMVLPGCLYADLSLMYKLKGEFPENVYLAAGLHPTELPQEGVAEELEKIAAKLRGHTADFVGVGEIGIDLYWDKSRREEQMVVFERQCGWAAELGLPVIIHCREGLDETLEVLHGLSKLPQGVFHSFSGVGADIERILSVGDFYFGINGIVTFKNSGLRQVLPSIPADRLLLETDSPYLAPVPKRGRRNESAYLPFTAACIAETLGTTVESISSQTTANARRLFRL